MLFCEPVFCILLTGYDICKFMSSRLLTTIMFSTDQAVGGILYEAEEAFGCPSDRWPRWNLAGAFSGATSPAHGHCYFTEAHSVGFFWPFWNSLVQTKRSERFPLPAQTNSLVFLITYHIPNQFCRCMFVMWDLLRGICSLPFEQLLLLMFCWWMRNHPYRCYTAAVTRLFES